MDILLDINQPMAKKFNPTAILDGLSVEELIQLAVVIERTVKQFRHSIEPDQQYQSPAFTELTPFETNWSRTLADPFMKAMGKRHGHGCGFAPVQLKPNLRKAAVVVSELIATHCPKIKNAEKEFLLSLFADLLVNSMKRRGCFLSWKNLLSEAENLPAVIETEFPGYLQSGLLPMLYRKRKE